MTTEIARKAVEQCVEILADYGVFLDDAVGGPACTVNAMTAIILAALNEQSRNVEQGLRRVLRMLGELEDKALGDYNWIDTRAKHVYLSRACECRVVIDELIRQIEALPAPPKEG